MKIYSVYDSKAECYLTPFFAPTAGVALRMFTQAAQDENHEFHKHAEDYTLFEIGEFDQDSAAILPLQAIKSLGNAIEYKTDERS